MVVLMCKLVYSGRLREEDRLSPGVRDQPWRTVRSHMQIYNKHCHVQRRNKVFLVGLTGRFNIDFWGIISSGTFLAFLAISLILCER